LRAGDSELEAVASPAPEANPDMRDQIIDAVMAGAIHADAVRSHPLGPGPTVVAPAAKLAFGRFWSEFRVWKGLTLTKGVHLHLPASVALLSWIVARLGG
jgi:hypothetical protein